ncbi:MAG TPA: hypothetical protein VG013_20875 [Gemmataceae bacterium]|jgi:hypothetical protein|nr:hypothetical protein [Gemmataceae bacterium]
MKYFTPQLYERLQNADPAVMDAVDADWEAASARYEQRRLVVGAALAPVLTRFEGILLHDATVLGISRRGAEFSILLLKDLPPWDLVTLTYTLTDEPYIDKNAVSSAHQSGVMQFEYDEFDVIEERGRNHCTHSILFSNGWEIRLRFRDVQVSLAQPVYPLPSVRFPAPPATATA